MTFFGGSSCCLYNLLINYTATVQNESTSSRNDSDYTTAPQSPHRDPEPFQPSSDMCMDDRQLPQADCSRFIPNHTNQDEGADDFELEYLNSDHGLGEHDSDDSDDSDQRDAAQAAELLARAASLIALSQPEQPAASSGTDGEVDDPLAATSSIGSIKIAQSFIKEIQAASLDNGGLDDDILERLRNPPKEPTDISDPDTRLSLDLYLAVTNSSEDTYKTCSVTGAGLDSEQTWIRRL